MSDVRRKNLAKILIHYSLGVKPGDWVIVSGDLVAAPLINDLVEQILLAGGHVDTVFASDEIMGTELRVATEEQLRWTSPLISFAAEHVDAFIELFGASNTRSLSRIDPAKQRARKQGQRPYLETFMRRYAEGKLRWVGSQQPCQAFAQEADMSLRDYEDFVYKSTFADQEDPVAHWLKMRDEQERLVQWLKGKQEVAVRGPHADLRLSIEGRAFINECGENNMPGGEIFTSPVEDSAQGWVEFTYPAITGGREVEGIRLEFEAGKVVRASAEKNQDYLLTMLETDEGSRFLGEFAIGTNYGIQEFTKNILFDEKIGGSMHMALGRGFPEAGGQNHSAIHWDMICDMQKESEIVVDGEVFYKDGKFRV
ncbi:MAG: aminopeptidase [Chloroflexota bacterium]